MGCHKGATECVRWNTHPRQPPLPSIPPITTSRHNLPSQSPVALSPELFPAPRFCILLIASHFQLCFGENSPKQNHNLLTDKHLQKRPFQKMPDQVGQEGLSRVGRAKVGRAGPGTTAGHRVRRLRAMSAPSSGWLGTDARCRQAR